MSSLLTKVQQANEKKIVKTVGVFSSQVISQKASFTVSAQSQVSSSGVGIKYNSYARYLARKTGLNSKQGPPVPYVNPKAVVNNKSQKFSILPS